MYAKCKLCKVKVKYVRYTTNMRTHIERIPEMKDVDQKPTIANILVSQRTLHQFSKLLANSEWARIITPSILFLNLENVNLLKKKKRYLLKDKKHLLPFYSFISLTSFYHQRHGVFKSLVCINCIFIIFLSAFNRA